MNESVVKLLNVQGLNPINLKDCKALSHPSNNSVFLIEGS